MIKKAIFLLVILALVALPAFSLPLHGVTGDWDVTCHIEGFTVPGKMTLKTAGEVVTGTVETEHTGHGTISNGTLKGGKLTFTANFEKHEAINFRGTYKDGKIEGDFTTEGNTGQWAAVPHKAR